MIHTAHEKIRREKAMPRACLRIISLLLILIFLTSCSLPDTGQINAQPPTTTAVASTTPIADPEKCPPQIGRRLLCLTPQTIRAAYGVDKLIQQGYTGKGQTVIDIVSFGSPTLREDMAVFNKTFSLPPLDLEIIAPINRPEQDPYHHKSGWAGETTLDVQIIHAIAPEAKVVVLVSPIAETEGIEGLPEFRELIQYAIDHKLGTIFSNSWGASELTFQDQAARDELQRWDTLLQKATTQQGMTFFASSGDHGATDYVDMAATELAKVPTTSFLASSPWVTSVGGTTVTKLGNVYNESVWNDHDDAASGGGFSSIYAMPDYQKTLPANTQLQFKNRRGIPDVSAAGDPSTGLAFYRAGVWNTAGGTSASAPVWAALTAIANQMAGRPLGFLNSALYKIATSDKYAQDFRDIIIGDNSNVAVNVPGYQAVAGWDGSTGLGSPNAPNLLPDLITATKP
jgi:subtilase family serine protease